MPKFNAKNGRCTSLLCHSVLLEPHHLTDLTRAPMDASLLSPDEPYSEYNSWKLKTTAPLRLLAWERRSVLDCEWEGCLRCRHCG
jgi:hypothetical protein